jgi:glucokinase
LIRFSGYLKQSNIAMPVMSFDLGGTKLAAALLSDEGKILFSETLLLDRREGKEVGNLLIEQVNFLIKKAHDKNIITGALGICVPGIAYAKNGKVWAPNIPGWEEYPLLDELQKGITDKNIPIKIDSDRACYILGEVWKGNARGCSNAIFLSVGTGIGAGILVDNQVLRGANDIAGAIGWLALSTPFNEQFISCGDFEYNASGPGLVKVAKALIEENQLPESGLLYINKESFSPKDIFDAYEKGDALAIVVMNNAIEYWGRAVANLVSLFNPEKIIFGGGLFGPALKFLDAIYAEAKKWAQPVSIQQVKLESSALGTEAGLYGAGFLALKNKTNV